MRDSVRTTKETVDLASKFAFWLRIQHLFVRLSALLFFVLLPVYLELIKSHPRLFLTYWSAVLAFVVITILWHVVLNELGKGLWIDPRSAKKEELSRVTTITVIASAILCCSLLYCWIWLSNYHFYVDDISRFFEATLVLNLVTLGLVFALVLAFLRYRREGRKESPLRLRSKVIRRLYIHPRELVEKALDALNVKYDQVRRGLNRRTLESLYEVQGHQILIEIHEKYLYAIIVTVAHTPEGVSTAEEIEKSIDRSLQSW